MYTYLLYIFRIYSIFLDLLSPLFHGVVYFYLIFFFFFFKKLLELVIFGLGFLVLTFDVTVAPATLTIETISYKSFYRL